MVVHAYYPLAETRVQREAEALVQAGYAVDVICLRDEGEARREICGGVDVHRLPVRVAKRSLGRQMLSYLAFLTVATARLTRLHVRHPYRSVQVHNLPDFLVFCALVPKLQGVPVILDLHDLMPEFFAGRFGAGQRPLVARAIRGQEQLACRFADHVVTVSEHWRQALIGRGVPAGKASVVMNLADDRIFRPRSVPQPAGAPSPDRPFRLLYHGTVTYRYGLDLAVDAVALLRDEIPGIRLTILGQGDQMPELTERVDRLGLHDHVDLQDRLLPAEDLPGVIAQADLGVVPYRDDVFTDGLLPTKLMEYAAVGLPCVAAGTQAITAYFDGTMAELVTPGDAADLARRVRELWRDPAGLERLACRSRVFTERHNWARAGADYVALVDSLAS
jgi:glycosyltransferase involved in cell wall biosynthesis